MKIGKIQLHLKARSHARLNHVSALLPLAIISPTPNRGLADCGHVLQESWLTRWEAPTVLFAVNPKTRGVIRMVRFLAQFQNGQLVISSAVWPNSGALNGRHQAGRIACCA